MTRNAINILITIMMLIGIIIFNKQIMPVRKEITELELTKVIGMDVLPNDEEYKYAQTVVRVETEEESKSNESSNSGSKTSKAKQKLFTVEGRTYSDIIRTFQTYINRSLTGSHINHILLGEDFVKQDISEGIDFNARDYEVRLNSRIYITKNSSSKDFLTNVLNDSYDIDQKLAIMEKNVESKSVSDEFTMTDLLRILVSTKSGLIPTLEIISIEDNNESLDTSKTNNNEEFSFGRIIKSENSETIFDYSGYAVIKDNKLLDYLNESESITANLLLNKAKGTNINIKEDDEKYISFGLLDYITKSSFDFESNTNELKKIKVNIEIRTNFDEIMSKENVFTIKKISELEEKQEHFIERQIYLLFNKVKEKKCDFLNIAREIKIKNPYKYKKIENNILEQIFNAEIEVNCECIIERTYDYTNLNEVEK